MLDEGGSGGGGGGGSGSGGEDDDGVLIAPPPRIEVARKEDETTDFFTLGGPQLAVKDSEVTVIREAKPRCSAFGAQVMMSGRMEWKLKITKGHSIRIGVSGVTKTSLVTRRKRRNFFFNF